MKTKWLFILLFGLMSRVALAQAPALNVPIAVTDNAGGRLELQFGLDPTATDTLDESLGEKRLPPFPPPSVFEARFVGEDISLPQLDQGTYNDYRTGDANFNGTKTHELKYQVGSGTTITIGWNLPTGITGLLQDLFGGVIVNKKMSGNDSLVVANPGALNKLKMIVTYTGIPFAPKLVSPADSAMKISVDTMLVWHVSGGATSYGLQVSTVADFSAKVVDVSGIVDTSFQVSGLQESTTYFWRVNATNDKGTSDWSEVWQFTTGQKTSVEQFGDNVPKEYVLAQNFPNPFNPVTTIEFSLPVLANAELTILDLKGRRVQTLMNRTLGPGRYRVQWNAEGFPSGTYFYRLQAGRFSQIRKLVLLK